MVYSNGHTKVGNIKNHFGNIRLDKKVSWETPGFPLYVRDVFMAKVGAWECIVT